MSLRRRTTGGVSVGVTRATGRVTLPRRSSSGRVIKENLKYGRPHAVFERIFDPDEMAKEGTDYTGLAPILQLESLSELPDFNDEDVNTCLVCCAPCGAKPQLAATLNQLSQILNSSAEHPANLLSSVMNYDVSQLQSDDVLCSHCASIFTELRSREMEAASLRDQLLARMMGGGEAAAAGSDSSQSLLTNGSSAVSTAAAAAETDSPADQSATEASVGPDLVQKPETLSAADVIGCPDEAAAQLCQQFSCGLLGLTAFAVPEPDDEAEYDDDDNDEDFQTGADYSGDEDYEEEDEDDEDDDIDSQDDYSSSARLTKSVPVDAAKAGGVSKLSAGNVTADEIADDLISLQQNSLGGRGRLLPASDKWSPDGDESPQLPCPLCPRIFLTEPERRQHTEQHMNERLNCELCSETVLRKHMPAHRAKHGASATAASSDPLTCAFCQKRFDSQARLNVHVKIRHGRSSAASGGGDGGGRRPRGRPRRTDSLAPRPGTCQYCGIYIKVDLQGHVNRFHTMVRPFECETCGQRLVSRHALAEHRQVFHSEGHRCQLCGMTFARKKQLSVHAWKRHSIGGVTCRVCGKSFARSDTLDGHMRCHQRPLACQLCPARFPFKRELRNHEHLRHGLHGEVPADNDYLPGEAYRCVKCGRCYGSWAARDRHTCDGSALSDLFVCQLCGDWSTRFEGDMVKHMRNLHNIEADTILIADVEQPEGTGEDADGDTKNGLAVDEQQPVGVGDGVASNGAAHDASMLDVISQTTAAPTDDQMRTEVAI